MAMFQSNPDTGFIDTWIPLSDSRFPKYNEFKKRLQTALEKAESEKSAEIF